MVLDNGRFMTSELAKITQILDEHFRVALSANKIVLNAISDWIESNKNMEQAALAKITSLEEKGDDLKRAILKTLAGANSLMQREDLMRFVDLHYTVAYSTVQNCDRAFRNRCPKRWVDLVVTGAPLVRWCTVCEQSVHFCLTDADIDRHAKQGNYIAYYDADTHTDTLGLAEFTA